MPSSELYITWLGQGGYLLDDGETRIVIDPYLSDAVEKVSGKKRLYPPPVAPEQLKCDLVICTHDHLDHLDPDLVEELDPSQAFAGPDSCTAHLRQLGRNNLFPLNRGSTMAMGNFALTAVFADHTTDSIGLMVNHNGHVLYFSGDTLYSERLLELSAFHPELVLICINGKLGNMNVQEAVQLTEALAPKVGIPAHYDLFAENAEDPQLYLKGLITVAGRLLERGQPTQLSQLGL